MLGSGESNMRRWIIENDWLEAIVALPLNKMLPNASYFAFTATPKNKTLEIFGEPYQERRQDQASARSTATR